MTSKERKLSEFSDDPRQFSGGVTKTTLSDLTFAETYLSYVARQKNPETRARAQILIATIAMLDARHPTWRTELLAEMAARGIERDIAEILPLPEVDTDRLYKEFINNILKR